MLRLKNSFKIKTEKDLKLLKQLLDIMRLHEYINNCIVFLIQKSYYIPAYVLINLKLTFNKYLPTIL